MGFHRKHWSVIPRQAEVRDREFIRITEIPIDINKVAVDIPKGARNEHRMIQSKSLELKFWCNEYIYPSRLAPTNARSFAACQTPYARNQVCHVAN